MKGSMEDKLWPIHKFWASKNWPSTAGCCRNGGTDGLIAGHAYSLLDVAKLKGGPRIAKVRNPWNKESYHGKFKDSDPIWDSHPEWKKQVNLQKADDGIFWMPYKTFVSYYQYSTVAMY